MDHAEIVSAVIIGASRTRIHDPKRPRAVEREQAEKRSKAKDQVQYRFYAGLTGPRRMSGARVVKVLNFARPSK
jgi:hypothetical protein